MVVTEKPWYFWARTRAAGRIWLSAAMVVRLSGDRTLLGPGRPQRSHQLCLRGVAPVRLPVNVHATR